VTQPPSIEKRPSPLTITRMRVFSANPVYAAKFRLVAALMPKSTCSKPPLR
jgi:hypothetical protein